MQRNTEKNQIELTRERLLHEYNLGSEEIPQNTLLRTAKDMGLKARLLKLSWNALVNLQKAYPAIAVLKSGRHPGFKLKSSEKQDFSNPEIKEKEASIKSLQKKLNRLYKKFSKVKSVFNKDGTSRQNSIKETLKVEIAALEDEVETIRQIKDGLPEKVDVSKLNKL